MRMGAIAVGREDVAMTFAGLIRGLVIAAAALIVATVIGFAVLIALGVSSATPAGAAGAKWPGPHPVELIAVKDGDTVDVRFRDGPCGRGPCPGSEVSIRVRGIDAPEVHACHQAGVDKAGRGKAQSCAACDAELALGRQAAATARQLLAGAAVRVRDIGPDAYNGRYVATIEVMSGGAWRSYADLMTAKGLAVAYDPQASGSYVKSKPWCARDQPASLPSGPAGAK